MDDNIREMIIQIVGLEKNSIIAMGLLSLASALLANILTIATIKLKSYKDYCIELNANIFALKYFVENVNLALNDRSYMVFMCSALKNSDFNTPLRMLDGCGLAILSDFIMLQYLMNRLESQMSLVNDENGTPPVLYTDIMSKCNCIGSKLNTVIAKKKLIMRLYGISPLDLYKETSSLLSQ